MGSREKHYIELLKGRLDKVEAFFKMKVQKGDMSAMFAKDYFPDEVDAWNREIFSLEQQLAAQTSAINKAYEYCDDCPSKGEKGDADFCPGIHCPVRTIKETLGDKKDGDRMSNNKITSMVDKPITRIADLAAKLKAAEKANHTLRCDNTILRGKVRAETYKHDIPPGATECTKCGRWPPETRFIPCPCPDKKEVV